MPLNNDELLAYTQQALQHHHWGRAEAATGQYLEAYLTPSPQPPNYASWPPHLQAHLHLERAQYGIEHLPEHLAHLALSPRLNDPKHIQFAERVVDFAMRRVDSVLALPAAPLLEMADLWDVSTQGRLGFKTQLVLWRACDFDAEQFFVKIGWYPASPSPGKFPSDDFVDGRRQSREHPPVGHFPAVVDRWTPMFHDTWMEDVIALNVALLCRLDQVSTRDDTKPLVQAMKKAKGGPGDKVPRRVRAEPCLHPHK